MADFEKCIPIVLQHEGGYVDNPLDKGGPTNYGISSLTLIHLLKRTVTIEDIKNLDIDIARQFYLINYWNHLKLDQVNSDIQALCLFDMGVLRGIGRVTDDIQTILGLTVDGIVGPRTLDKINYGGFLNLPAEFLLQQQLAFCEIVKANPSQTIFLTGWIKRTHDLLEYALGLKTL